MRIIVGLGSHLMRDDSVGLRVAEALAAGNPGKESRFEVALLRGSGLELFGILDQPLRKLLFVDCAFGIGKPGEYRVFETAEVASNKILMGRSTHEGDLLRLLKTSVELGYVLPPIRILGVEPQDVSFGEGLSAPLEASFAHYLSEAISQIESDSW